jgi:hypothetical protein
MKPHKTIITVVFLLFTVSSFTQTKEESLQWLRSHLKTLVIHYNDSILPYTMTKTYTFYDDVFVVKTVKDFYKDRSLNIHPAFSKIWYKDIIPETNIAFQDEHPDSVNVFTITANPVYGIIGKEEAPMKYWRHFDEPSGLDLYLPEDKVLSMEAIKRLMLLANKDSIGQQNQTEKSNPLLWLQQHQKALTYRVPGNEDDGYQEESFRFLPGKIVQQTIRYDKGRELLSSDEQDWFYSDFQPIGDIDSFAIDTVSEKLGLIRLAMETGLTDIRTGEIIGYPVFELGFPMGDNVAKQKVLDAINALKKLTSQDKTSGSAYPNNIRRDYSMLANTINRQKFPFPPTMGYRITAKLKDGYRLVISESRPHFRHEFTLWLPGLVRFTLMPDTTGYNKDAVHFVLQTKDSVLVETSVNGHSSQYVRRPWAVFTLENPHLIAKTEVLLTNICYDNDRRKKWNEAKKLEETY